MALSERAAAVKAELQQAVADKRECEAMEVEWRDLLAWDDEPEGDCEARLEVIEELFAERAALRRRLAERQLRNFVRLQHVPMNALQRRLMRRRYVLGKTWPEIVALEGKSKQYLLREHNKVLERMR